MAFLRTERGFVYPQSDEKDLKKIWYVSPAINALYREHCDHRVNKLDWGWIGKTAEICAKQISVKGKKNIFQIQLDDDSTVSFRAIDFLIDSMTYLRTGRRRISVDHWFDLLEVQPEKFVSLPNEQIRKIKNDHGQYLSMSPVDLVCSWLKHPDGLDDLVTTMMIIFGDSQKVEK